MTSNGVTRRAVLAGAGALAAAGSAPGAAAAAGVRRLGEPGDGAPAAEVVGEVAQDGNGLTGYGYLTSLFGAAIALCSRSASYGLTKISQDVLLAPSRPSGFFMGP